jgi:hypothetical protein
MGVVAMGVREARNVNHRSFTFKANEAPRYDAQVMPHGACIRKRNMGKMSP